MLRVSHDLRNSCVPWQSQQKMRAIWYVRKYLRNAITKFLFHSNDHQWSKAVFGASSSRPTSDHCEKGVQEYATERTVEGQDGWKGRGRRDRSRSKHVLTLGIVREDPRRA